MSIPNNSNFMNLSCQLGGLRLNGNISNGTAINGNVLIIDDPIAAQTLTKTITGKFVQINIAGGIYYIPLYQ
jgi:hypothetical protein